MGKREQQVEVEKNRGEVSERRRGGSVREGEERNATEKRRVVEERTREKLEEGRKEE